MGHSHAESPTPPHQIAQQMLEGQRIAGDKYILLPDATMARLRDAGIHKVHTKVYVCLDKTGTPYAIDLKQPLGDAEGDKRIHDTIAEWRYQPFIVDGKPVNVCFHVVFNYTIQ
jgi:hypothetical protein